MIIVTRDLGCDRVGCHVWAEGGCEMTAKEVRAKVFSGSGWVRRNGKDLCPRCARKEEQ